jgi:energy-converting hydrogenase Eha subunit A
MKNKRFMGILLAVAMLLCIPLVAMQFTNEVVWTLSDFIIAGILLLGTGIVIEVIARNVKEKRAKIGMVAGTLIVLVLVWAELAVGIFGSPLAGS